MPPTRVLVLYNNPVLPVGHSDHESEQEIVHAVDFVSETLSQAGFDVARLGLGYDPAALLDHLRNQRPEVVLNLFEGIADHDNTESFVAGLLDWMDVPFTGSPFLPLCLARSKHLTKYLFQGAGLPTPEFFVVEKLPIRSCPLKWPVIVKPAQQDASVGLDQKSVVTNLDQLRHRVSHLLDNYGPPVLLERFIRGRELNVALIETSSLRTLPISEVLFLDKDPAYWPIITYDAKWRPASRDFKATPARYPAEVAPKLAGQLESLARKAYRLVGCRDYARVDFRIDAAGQPYLLEVNPNPDFSPNAGLARGLLAAGITHAQFTVDLVKCALGRARKK